MIPILDIKVELSSSPNGGLPGSGGGVNPTPPIIPCGLLALVGGGFLVLADSDYFVKLV